MLCPPAGGEVESIRRDIMGQPASSGSSVGHFTPGQFPSRIFPTNPNHKRNANPNTNPTIPTPNSNPNRAG